MEGCLEVLGCPEGRGPHSDPHCTGLVMLTVLEVLAVDGWVPGLGAGYWSGVWVWHMAARWEGRVTSGIG